MFLVKSKNGHGDEFVRTFTGYREALAYAIGLHGYKATFDSRLTTGEKEWAYAGEAVLCEWNDRGPAHADVIAYVETPPRDPCAKLLTERILAAWPRLCESLPEQFYHLAKYHSALRYVTGFGTHEREPHGNSLFTLASCWETLSEGIAQYGWAPEATIEDGRNTAREYLGRLTPEELVSAYTANCCEDYR